MKIFNSFEKYLDWINNRVPKSDKHTLDNIRYLLKRFDNPENDYDIIHVAGTNGKGSTCHYLSSVLSKNHRVGLFISPYIDTILESIQINGDYISAEDFCNILDEFIPVIEEMDKNNQYITYFEILTAIMFKYFSDKKVDVAVVEVGLGGTLDSTNVITHPIASVITSISMDHIDILGDNISEIARNKAGIIKENSTVFLYPQIFIESEEIIKEYAEKLNSRVYTFSLDEIKNISLSLDENSFTFRDYNVVTKLIGKHQLYNASLSICVLDYFKEKFNLSKKDILDGLKEAINPGRLELISENPKFLIDGSHNSDAIDQLIDSLKNYSYNNLILGFSMLKDKDYKYALKKLSTLTDTCVITEINNSRRLDIEDLEKISKNYFKKVIPVKNLKNAISLTETCAKKDDLILWCGSLYLMKEIKSLK